MGDTDNLYVCLEIFDDEMHPDEITSITGIVPTSSAPKWSRSMERKLPRTNSWSYSVEAGPGEDTDDIWPRFFAHVSGHEAGIKRAFSLAKKSVIFVVSTPAERIPYIGIPAYISKLAADIGCIIEIEIYADIVSDVKTELK